MLFAAADHGRGSVLPWGVALMKRFVAVDGESAGPVGVQDVAGRPIADPVDCAIALRTSDKPRVMSGDDPSGDVDIHPFNFLCRIGNGNFGTVLLAQSRVYPTRFFAAKTLTCLLESPSFALMQLRSENVSLLETLRQVFFCENPDVVSRFPSLADLHREAQVAATLPQHPHIARFYGIIFSSSSPSETKEKDVPYMFYSVSSQTGVGAHMLMELGAGGTLGDFFRYRSCYIAEEHLVCWLGQLLRGLECLHKRGVIHRDIKPANILLRRSASAAWESDTEFFFVDFGIAALVKDSNFETERTLIGAGVYCPPEIAKYWGYRKRCSYSYASDIWSTAAIFYVFLTCGADKVDKGMAAVCSNKSSSCFTNSATSSRVRVARGDYPSLILLKQIPLLDDDALRRAQAKLAARCAGEGGEYSTCGDDDVEYTQYTTVGDDDDDNDLSTTNAGEWPAWVFSPDIQVMARHLRVRELSSEFLSLIDSMMALNPADRPRAEQILLDSTIFGMRIPWWEKAVELAMRRVAEGEENVLLDVCIGDSDEEEEEDEEEAALMRRAMTPLVVPAENNGYIPHNVIHWWYMDLTRGEKDPRKWLPPTSFLGSLLACMRGLTGFEASSDGVKLAASDVRKEMTLFTTTSLKFLERVFVPIHDTNVSATTTLNNGGPLLQELKARGVDHNVFIHVQLRIRASTNATRVLLRNEWCADEDEADKEDMARYAMEELVATTKMWLRSREGNSDETALHVLPWVSWHIDEEDVAAGSGEAQYCFILEYVAIGNKNHEPQPYLYQNYITGEISSFFCDWRANLKDAFNRLSHDIANASARGNVLQSNEKMIYTQDNHSRLESNFLEMLGKLKVAESELMGKKENEPHQGLLQGHVVHWLCMKSAPSMEICMDVLNRMAETPQASTEYVDKFISTYVLTTECVMALRPGYIVESQTNLLP